MRFFNTAGPVVSSQHYHIPPLSRVDLKGILQFIGAWRYFALHAPPQTGKTSILLSLRDHLNATGEYRCVYANVEIAQTAREDVAEAMRAILSALSLRAQNTLGDPHPGAVWQELLKNSGPNAAL